MSCGDGMGMRRRGGVKSHPGAALHYSVTCVQAGDDARLFPRVWPQRRRHDRPSGARQRLQVDGKTVQQGGAGPDDQPRGQGPVGNPRLRGVRQEGVRMSGSVRRSYSASFITVNRRDNTSLLDSLSCACPVRLRPLLVYAWWTWNCKIAVYL